jgi:ATP/ADP translocase
LNIFALFSVFFVVCFAVFAAIVNHSININITNNHLSPKFIEHKKKTMTYGIGNQGSGLGQAQIYDRVKPVNGIPPLPS